jgi:DNA-binding IclR family transcriptional regulator
MEAELRAIRRRGYALSTGELEEGLSSCAVALPAHLDRPYAINVSAPAARMPRKLVGERFVLLLRRTADEIAELVTPVEFGQEGRAGR